MEKNTLVTFLIGLYFSVVGDPHVVKKHLFNRCFLLLRMTVIKRGLHVIVCSFILNDGSETKTARYY